VPVVEAGAVVGDAGDRERMAEHPVVGYEHDAADVEADGIDVGAVERERRSGGHRCTLRVHRWPHRRFVATGRLCFWTSLRSVIPASVTGERRPRPTAPARREQRAARRPDAPR
jgi:hypothetical protein